MKVPLVVQNEAQSFATTVMHDIYQHHQQWTDTLLVPLFASLTSAVYLLVHFLRHTPRREPVTTTYSNAHGGWRIVVVELLTLAGTLDLARLFVIAALNAEGKDRVAALGPCIAIIYAAVLSSAAVFSHRPSIVSQHITLVLFTTWLTYVIRDILPLTTYTQHPIDQFSSLSQILIELTIFGVILPAFSPRRHIPIDPFDPKEPNPEQTASPISLLFFGYLNSVVWKGYHLPSLPLSALPPLADTDHAANLVRSAFPKLDPFWSQEKDAVRGVKGRKRPNIILSLLSVMRGELVRMVFLQLLSTAFILVVPYTTRQLLLYLENRDHLEGQTFRPWLWITVLFFTPFSYAILTQQYRKSIAKVTVRTEAIFTQLLLTHALRVRIIAEGRSDSATTPTHTPEPSTSGTSTPKDKSSTSSKQTGSSKPTGDADKKQNGVSSKSASMVGRLNNLITTDMQAIGRATDFLQPFVAAPLMGIGSVVLLYQLLGYAALVGLGTMLLFLPVPIASSRALQGASKTVAKKSDERVEIVTETMSVIRMIKLFGWEKRMAEKIDAARSEELSWVWWNKVYALLTQSTQFIIPAAIMCSSFSVYALVMKQPLDAATVFPAMTLFNSLRNSLSQTLNWVPIVIKGQVSLNRIGDFLHESELLDEFNEKAEDVISAVPEQAEKEIGFNDATFSWSNEPDSGTLTPSKRRFRLSIKDELLFRKGAINIIVGPTGCGKTSMLMALLGEMKFIPSGPQSWFNLPRKGGVAYAAQESWVMNATIRDNILFESRYDEERYNQVIEQCGLTRDLQLFQAGDRTEVGEKGLTLSGGQKARVTLARTVYSSAEVLLLDDVFAALDVHTSKWIAERCFSSDLIRGRTVIMVTHNVTLMAPISQFVVSLGPDGTVLSQGTLSEALEKNSSLRLEVAKESDAEKKAEEVVDGSVPAIESETTDKDAGKLIVEEESGEGHISWESVKMYLVALGGKHWATFWIAFTAATYFECAIEIVQPWLMGEWARQYTIHPPEEVNVPFYLTGYVGLVSLMFLVYACAQLTLTDGALRGSEALHRRLLHAILGTTLRWLDKTPTSRVITRVTADVAAVDVTIPDIFSRMFEIWTILVLRFLTIVLFAPNLGIVGVVIVGAAATLGNMYSKSQLSVKREMSKAKSPVVAHFGASIEGLTSIRAYGAQESVLAGSLHKIDNYSRAFRVYNELACWIAVWVGILGCLFPTSLAIHYVYFAKPGVPTSDLGFTLSIAAGFGQLTLGFVQSLNMFEVSGNSLERLLEYMTIEQEPQNERVPPAHWPSSGALNVEKLSARYSANGPKVLHDLTFQLKSGERIGIVGRTGSGKSSLTLSLLRCILTEGEVYFDGIPTSSISLESLRNQITIIPQVPELLSGSLRRNLDPFEQYDDATLNAALRDAGLSSLQSEDDEDQNNITLDSAMARGGSNLSVGQRQIIALARAMVRESKVLILDEATSAIDYKTDAVIQRSLRTGLKKDVTIITVAHRLQTIMDSDRIMVLDAGKIVEFDSPSMLLKNDSGFLKSLVDESSDKAELYEMAQSAA